MTLLHGADSFFLMIPMDKISRQAEDCTKRPCFYHDRRSPTGSVALKGFSVRRVFI